MIEERIDNGTIPTKLYQPDGASALLLLGHGRGGSKDVEPYVGLCRRYAEATGLAVVCIDAIAHGERGSEDPREQTRVTGAADAAERMVADWTTTVDALSSIGPAVAFAGFSMVMLFGAPTVAAMPSIKAAVFGVGGIPRGGPGFDNTALGDRLLGIARTLEHPQVLMMNMTEDELFDPVDSMRFFAAIPGRKKRMMFWEGGHHGLPAESIRQSVAFLQKYATT
ncbi:MAG: hypothetical protein QOI47_2590 [Actinomycetota bacterium]|nr:hypothetical protein [Actinomycetota bacterium]